CGRQVRGVRDPDQRGGADCLPAGEARRRGDHDAPEVVGADAELDDPAAEPVGAVEEEPTVDPVEPADEDPPVEPVGAAEDDPPVELLGVDGGS
ncbi:MAG: hypothetical protein J2O48_09070, partial [Solirubrobacterales bacterium]|nr:hypothetical protein [Solirubrobacterales bacterium]